MNVQASLLRQLENPKLSRDQRAQLRCQLAKELEEAGDYEAARQAMGELWQRIGEHPRLEGLETSTIGEVLLRAGTLTGWIGSKNQLAGAQEIAKNLITEGMTVFEAHSYLKKVVEAQTELAYCYWREGAFDEARDTLKGVLTRLTADNELKAKATVRSAIVEWSALRYSESLQILTNAAPLFEKIKNHTVRGGYHNALAGVLEDIGTKEQRGDYLDRAFIEYAAAGFHFEQAGHKCYRANVENNLGFLYFKAGKLKEAHEHLDRARRLLVNLKDYGGVAQVDETRARVFLAEGRIFEAERTASAAVTALGQGGRQSLLAEALTTQGTVLARLKHYDHAHALFLRAMEVAHLSGAQNTAGMAALTMLEELSASLDINERQTIYERAYDWLIPSHNLQAAHRLLEVANRILSAGRKKKAAKAEAPAEIGTATLDDMMLRYEKDIIRQALTATRGSISRAAHLLGTTHQRLGYILESRHRDLCPFRTPIKRRKKSIIRKK
ncbi:MAG TPA: helix-turn-helix domain-containing protein [Pyrinomonadaceae bacterium]|jgi:tetratricopeptide (TPR) repeat protein